MYRQVCRVLATLVMGCLLSACALSEDKVPIDFVSAGTPASLAGAENVTVSLDAADKRTQYGDRIGTKKNGYGMEMARIVATNDVVELVRSSLEQTLKAQGFRVGGGGAAIAIEVQNFYNNFKVGAFSGIAAAEVNFSVKVRDASGALLYQQFYSGTGSVEGVMLASGTNAKAGVEKALGAAIKTASEDVELQKALLSTRPKAAPARRVS